MKHQAIHDAVTRLCSSLETVKPSDTLHCSFVADDIAACLPGALDSLRNAIEEGKYTQVASVSVYEKDNLIKINIEVR